MCYGVGVCVATGLRDGCSVFVLRNGCWCGGEVDDFDLRTVRVLWRSGGWTGEVR